MNKIEKSKTYKYYHYMKLLLLIILVKNININTNIQIQKKQIDKQINKKDKIKLVYKINISDNTKIAMSISSPRKHHNRSPNKEQKLIPQYLNFIRKNHLKFQLQQRLSNNYQSNNHHINSNPNNNNHINNHLHNNNLNKQSMDNMIFDDKKQFYQINSLKKISPYLSQQDNQNIVDKFIADKMKQQYLKVSQKDQLAKNYKTIDIVTQAHHQKYLQLGDSLIVGKRKQIPQNLQNINNQILKTKPNKNSTQLQQRQYNPQNQQSLLHNQQLIKALKKKNKQIASKLRIPSYQDTQPQRQNNSTQQVVNQTLKYRSQTPNNVNNNSDIIKNGHNNKQIFSASPVLKHPVSEFKIPKPNQSTKQSSSQSNKQSNGQINNKSNKESNLLIKKQNMRDLWKQKFINWNNKQSDKRYDKKKPHSQLKFPLINIKGGQQKKRKPESYNDQMRDKSGYYQQMLQLDDCNLIRNSRPKYAKYNNHISEKELVTQNNSLQLLNYQSLQLERLKQKQIQQNKNYKVQEWEKQFLNKEYQRQNSIENYHQKLKQSNPEYSSSVLHNNHSVSVIKRRRNVPQKVTNFLLSTDPNNVQYGHSNISNNKNQLQQSTQSKRSRKNYKQIMKQKQKQFQNYLIQNSILKSTKIVNYYQKQQIKKKILFNQLQKNYCYLQDKNNIQLNSKQLKQLQLRNQNILQISNRQTNSNNKNNKQKQLTNTKQEKQKTNDTQQQIKQSSTNQTNLLISSQPQQQSNQLTNLIQRQQLSPQKKKGPNINSIKKQYDLSIYQIKIRSYKEFIFMMNLTHKVFINIPIKPASQIKNQSKFTYFIGKGNNRLLIKSLMNRRFWWEQTKQMNKANFVWTQLKVNQLYQNQKVSPYSSVQNKFDKFQQVQINSPKRQIRKKNSQKQPQKAGSYKPPLPEFHQQKILTKLDIQLYDNIMSNLPQNPDNALNYSNRSKFMPIQTFDTSYTQQILHQQKVHNHLQFNYFIGNKKALFYNLHNYYKLLGNNAFDIIPYTLHIKKGVQDPAYNVFLKEYKRIAKQQANNGLKNIWIVKPGQLSNRGQGITVIDQVYELNNILKKKEKHNNGSEKSYILQKYIQKPLLYKNRKFDIRHYVLLTRFHGRFRAYFYSQGYIRTSSHQFKLDQLDQMIHLTNDAIQKYGDSYGKHEDGNKVSYTQFQRYLDSIYGQGKHNFAEQIYPKMKGIALDAIKATYAQLDPKRLQHNFELLGLDFMIDNRFNVWLIQVNTNPCLQLSSKLLQRIIPQMAQNTLRICLDPLFPPPTHYPNSLKHLCPDNPLQRLQYQLIFDEARDGKQVQELFTKCNLKQLYKDMGQVDQQDATFQNDGKQIQLKNQKGVQDNQ